MIVSTQVVFGFYALFLFYRATGVSKVYKTLWNFNVFCRPTRPLARETSLSTALLAWSVAQRIYHFVQSTSIYYISRSLPSLLLPRQRWLQSKKLPSWALSVRPKFNKPSTAAKAVATVGEAGGSQGAKCRILVLLRCKKIVFLGVPGMMIKLLRGSFTLLDTRLARQL